MEDILLCEMNQTQKKIVVFSYAEFKKNQVHKGYLLGNY